MKQCPLSADGDPNLTDTSPVQGGKLSRIDDLKPGRLFQKTYRIVHKLGEGSLGPVYLADHVFLDELSALRLLPLQLILDESLAARFRHELHALRQVRSSNVVHAGDLKYAEDETPFMAVEYVDGPNLQTILDIAPGPFDVDLTLAITRSIAQGLVAAHACGLVHRDIKPKNILMAREGASWVPKIAGFAVVAIKEHSASLGSTVQTVLTPIYAAPEQWYGTDPADLDGRTDLYALGGILVEMLTGRTAFHAADYDGWAMQHLKAQPPPPSSLRPDLARWHGLDDLILSLLAKDREARPRSAAELLLLLDAVQFRTPVPQLATANVVEEEIQTTQAPETGLPVTTLPEVIEEEPSLIATPPSTTVIPAPNTETNTDTNVAAVEESVSLSAPPTISDGIDTTQAVEEQLTAAAIPPATPVPPETSTETGTDTNAPAVEEAVSVPVPPTISDGMNTTQAAEEELARFRVPPPISTPVYQFMVTAVQRSTVVEPPGTLATQAAAEEPISLVEPPTVSVGADAHIAVEDGSEKPDDFHLWLRQYARRNPTQAPEKPVQPPAAEVSLDMPRDTIEKPQEPAQPQDLIAGPDLKNDAGQETKNFPAPEIAIPGAEPPIALTPEQKELAELLRIFSAASAAGTSQGKPGGSTILGRFFSGANAGKVAEAAGRIPAGPAILPAPSSTAQYPAAAGSIDTAAMQPPSAHANPVREPDPHAAAGTPHETTSERFTHPVWKVLAALILLAVLGFAGWRLSYTDPKLPPANLSKGCNAGDARACTQLAAWYEQTNTVKDGDAKAVTYYAKACDASFPLACRKLGYKYLFGKGIPEDNPRAMTRLAKACDQGDFESCDVLAEIYHNGNYVEKNDEQATQLYSRSCSLGEDFGCRWATRLEALKSPAPAVPPAHFPRPTTTSVAASVASPLLKPKPSPATVAQPAPPTQ